MNETVHVLFARPCDAREASRALSERLGAVEVRDGELVVGGRCVEEVSHALDQWLSDQELPFCPEAEDAHTIVVRPPGD